MKIRFADRADLPSIVEIYNSTIADRLATADTEPISVASRLDWFERHSGDRHPIWIMENEGEVAGWLSLQEFYGRPAYYRTVEASIYVKKSYRRRGIGRQLLERAIAEAPNLGLNTLLGFIFGHNLPSLELFNQCGFQQWGYLPKVAILNGIERDLVILGLQMNELTS
jgi:phosphinothricin acetyltransferase